MARAAITVTAAVMTEAGKRVAAAMERVRRENLDRVGEAAMKEEAEAAETEMAAARAVAVPQMEVEAITEIAAGRAMEAPPRVVRAMKAELTA